MLLVQFKNAAGERRVGILEQGALREINGFNTSYALAQQAIRSKTSLAALAQASSGATVHALGSVTVLAPLDHEDAAHCYVTGTGLTHLGSADTRDAMHKKIGGDVDTLSDSMKMFRLGVEGGKPAAGQRGVQPEWFYKGDGTIVRCM